MSAWVGPDPIGLCAELRDLGYTAFVGNDLFLYLDDPAAAFLALCRGYVQHR